MERTMSVPGYVEVAFDAVLGAFAAEATIAELLDAATVEAFPVGSIVRIQAAAPERITARSARVKLAWQFIDPGSHRFEGEACIQLLVLQSGNDPMTELLVTMTIDDAYGQAVAGMVHRFLDELVARLAYVSAG